MSQKKSEIEQMETLFSDYIKSVKRYVGTHFNDREKLEVLAGVLLKQKDMITLTHDCVQEYTEAIHHVEVQLANLKGNMLKAVSESEPKHQTLEIDFHTH